VLAAEKGTRELRGLLKGGVVEVEQQPLYFEEVDHQIE
jgi:hypothetical protein